MDQTIEIRKFRMKVLFVSSGNAKDGISPIVKCQGASLICQDVQLEFFTIKGKGLQSYFRYIFVLRKYLKTNKFDIIHAHYSLSAYVASLAGAKPLIVSLMGSDVKSNKTIKFLIHFFNFLFKWKQVIVKSEDLKKGLRIKEAEVIPNGVDLDLFKPSEKCFSQDKLGWDSAKKHILFAANPNRPEKNFKLASEALALINNPHVEMHILENVIHNQIPIWMNASDVVLLTSLWEGSPNVIKEAMACNRPIVATNVGDISWLFGNEPGHFISSFKPDELSDKIKLALDYSGYNKNTKGRDRIISFGLDSENVAKVIVGIYKKCVDNNEDSQK